MRRRLTRARSALALLGAGAVGAAVLAGCGGSAPVTKEDLAAGKQKFTSLCGSCHMLQDAKTTGRIGPDLDDAFRGSREQGFKESQFRGVVEEWIRIAQKPMPRNLVKGQDAENVAAYVASVAGVDPDSVVLPAQGQPDAVQPPSELPKPKEAEPAKAAPAAPAAGQPIPVEADPGGALAFVQKTLTAPPGKVTFKFTNPATYDHDFAIKGVGKPTKLVKNGASAQTTVDIKPGTYEFYCTVPGHEQAGMKGTLTVK
jgi:plastocyanin/mono/diheme cytochrome c family protein